MSAPTGTRITLASALSTPGLTAWQALFEHARLTAGQHLLIHGASGAVGSFAIQLAKSADATVTATASARNLDAVAALGADEAYNYNGPTPTGLRVQRFDVVLNLAPTDPAAMAALLTLLHDRGTLVSTVAPPPADARINGIRMTAHADTKQLDALAARVAAGTLIVTVARVVGLVDVARVHHDYETGHLRGKTVFDAVLAR